MANRIDIKKFPVPEFGRTAAVCHSQKCFLSLFSDDSSYFNKKCDYSVTVYIIANTGKRKIVVKRTKIQLWNKVTSLHNFTAKDYKLFQPNEETQNFTDWITDFIVLYISILKIIPNMLSSNMFILFPLVCGTCIVK